MGARRVRPGTTKVSGLTPDNVRLLTEVADARLIPGLAITPTTCTFHTGAATAHKDMLDAIAKRKADGLETRALWAVARKLEKQVRPGDEGKPRETVVVKASKRLPSSKCNHQQPEGGASVGEGRIKCLCCGLIWDVKKDVRIKGERFTVEPGQPAVTKEMIDRAMPVAPRRQPEAGLFVVARHGDAWLVVSLGGLTRVVATCTSEADAEMVASALLAVGR